MTKQAFKPIPSPFNISGKTDEQATQDAFVEYVGGESKAEQMSRLWNYSYATPWNPGDRYYRSKNQVFRDKCLREGFDDMDVDAFMKL